MTENKTNPRTRSRNRATGGRQQGQGYKRKEMKQQPNRSNSETYHKRAACASMVLPIGDAIAVLGGESRGVHIRRDLARSVASSGRRRLSQRSIIRLLWLGSEGPKVLGQEGEPGETWEGWRTTRRLGVYRGLNWTWEMWCWMA